MCILAGMGQMTPAANTLEDTQIISAIGYTSKDTIAALSQEQHYNKKVLIEFECFRENYSSTPSYFIFLVDKMQLFYFVMEIKNNDFKIVLSP